MIAKVVIMKKDNVAYEKYEGNWLAMDYWNAAGSLVQIKFLKIKDYKLIDVCHLNR